MSEGRFLTIFPLPTGAEDEVNRLFESIREKDSTWIWKIKIINEEQKVIIYSNGKNQSRMRGAWLQGRTDLFKGLTYTTTHNLTMKTSLKEKPKDVVGLRAILKRDKIWKEASKGETEKAI